jgi:hypothetical protein
MAQYRSVKKSRHPWMPGQHVGVLAPRVIRKVVGYG